MNTNFVVKVGISLLNIVTSEFFLVKDYFRVVLSHLVFTPSRPLRQASLENSIIIVMSF